MQNEETRDEETRDEEDEIKSEFRTSKHISIKVVNSEGNEVCFKIKKNTKLRKLMDAYCKRQGLVNGSVRFSFDGNRVNPEMTPDDIGMQSDDIIDAMVEQTGGQRYYHYSCSYLVDGSYICGEEMRDFVDTDDCNDDCIAEMYAETIHRTLEELEIE